LTPFPPPGNFSWGLSTLLPPRRFRLEKHSFLELDFSFCLFKLLGPFFLFRLDSFPKPLFGGVKTVSVASSNSLFFFFPRLLLYFIPPLVTPTPFDGSFLFNPFPLFFDNSVCQKFLFGPLSPSRFPDGPPPPRVVLPPIFFLDVGKNSCPLLWRHRKRLPVLFSLFFFVHEDLPLLRSPQTRTVQLLTYVPFFSSPRQSSFFSGIGPSFLGWPPPNNPFPPLPSHPLPFQLWPACPQLFPVREEFSTNPSSS